MPSLVFNALFSSFFVVRVAKGRWMRNPHYLAAAMLASLVSLLILDACSSGSADSLIYGNLASMAGGWLGIALYDHVSAAL